MADRFLLADVGGTNTRVGLGGVDGLEQQSVQSFNNADHSGLAEIFTAYLEQHHEPVTAICAGVAGPVRAGNAQLTNLDWFIDAEKLRAETGAGEVRLLNDMQAQAYALDDLDESSLISLFPGAPPPRDAARLVMGIGTGCNIAVVHRTDNGLFVPASESGHTCLPHMDGPAGDIIAHLAKTQSHKPIEAALSGPGLSQIHRFLHDITLSPAQIIALYEAGDLEAKDTLLHFTQVLGVVAGDIALSHLPMGGVFFFGGTGRAIAAHLSALGFTERFTDKGPYTAIMQDIPIHLITDDSAALRGCARCLLQTRK